MCFPKEFQVKVENPIDDEERRQLNKLKPVGFAINGNFFCFQCLSVNPINTPEILRNGGVNRMITAFLNAF